MDNGRDMSCDTVPLSYVELANRLGIDVQSARRRSLRSKWAKSKGNDGRTRVHVPATVLPAAGRTVPAAVAAADATFTPAVAVTPEVLSHAGEVPALRQELGRAQGEAAALREALARETEQRERVETERETLAAELIRQMERTARAEGETAAYRDAFQQAQGRAERAQEGQQAAERALTAWTSGGPLARAWRGFWRS